MSKEEDWRLAWRLASGQINSQKDQDYWPAYAAAVRVGQDDPEILAAVDALVAEQTQTRLERSQRVKAAQRTIRAGVEPDPPTRHSLPPPRKSDAFAITRPVIDDDHRLAEGCRRFLRWLTSRHEVRTTGHFVTYNRSLATRLGVSQRTTQRYREAARKFGYIREYRDSKKRLVIEVHPDVYKAAQAAAPRKFGWATEVSPFLAPIKKKGLPEAKVIHSLTRKLTRWGLANNPSGS